MIRSFRHRGLKRLYEHGDASKIGATFADRVEAALGLLDVAETLKDVDLPGYRLHALKGNLKGWWSITISGNWRIIFRFAGGHAHDVDFVDYH